VVTRHVVRLAERAAPTDLLESGEIRAAGETIPRLIHNLRHYHGGL